MHITAVHIFIVSEDPVSTSHRVPLQRRVAEQQSCLTKTNMEIKGHDTAGKTPDHNDQLEERKFMEAMFPG
jgi:hypothetical protein